MFAHRRVACTAKFLGCDGAQVDEATDEIEDDREGREEASEYCVETSDIDSGEDIDDADATSEDRRTTVGKPSETLGFHSDVWSRVDLARDASCIWHMA